MSNVKGDQQDTTKSEARTYPLEAIMAMQKALEEGIEDAEVEGSEIEKRTVPPTRSAQPRDSLRSDLTVNVLTGLSRSFVNLLLRLKDIRLFVFTRNKRSRRISAR